MTTIAIRIDNDMAAELQGGQAAIKIHYHGEDYGELVMRIPVTKAGFEANKNSLPDNLKYFLDELEKWGR